MLNRRTVFRLLLICLLAAGCRVGGAAARTNWTVLVYMSADNELDRYAMNNIHEMEAVAPLAEAVDAGVTVLVQLDRANTNTAPGTWTDTRRYRIVRDPAMAKYYAGDLCIPPLDAITPHGVRPGAVPPPRRLNLPLESVVPADPPGGQTLIRSPRLDTPPLGELDMGDAQTLRDFIRWGQRTAPARHYLLITWGHGCGWTLDDDALDEPDAVHPSATTVSSPHVPPARSAGKSKACCEDDGAAPDYTSINSAELSDALADTEHIDVLTMDNCMMAMLEVAYQIRHRVDYLVASEEEIPDRGFYYPGIINELVRTHGTLAPAQVARYIAGDTLAAWQHFGIRACLTLSVIDLHKVAAAVQALDRLATCLAHLHAASARAALARARAACKQFGMVTDYLEPSHLIDLSDYLARADHALRRPALHRAIADCRRALCACVSANYTSAPYAFAAGLSIYLPPGTQMTPERIRTYGAFTLAKESAWGQWVRRSP